MKELSSPDELWRIPQLDGVRGLAIALVLFQHFVADPIILGTSRLGDFIKNTFSLGWSGVDLFFVLSGFLIGGILMDNRNSENYFKTFYIRRCSRILPLYFLNLAFFIGLYFLLAGHSSKTWFYELFVEGKTPFWINLMFLQNLFQAVTGKLNADWLCVTWSLVVEDQFYLVLPLLIWLLRPTWLRPILLAIICINPMVHLFVWLNYPTHLDVVTILIPLRGDALLFGVICAFVIRQDNLKIWLVNHGKQLHAAFFILVLGAIYIGPRYYDDRFIFDKILFYNFWIASLYAYLLLLVTTQNKGFIASTLKFSPLRKLGIISYGVYLFHWAINDLLHGLILDKDRRYREPSDILITMAALFVTLIFTSMLWRFIEKPIIAWGHSFTYRQPKNI